MKITRFSISKSDIIQYFNDLPQRVFSKDDISNILSDQRRFWRLSASLRIDPFIDLLLNNTKLEKHVLNFKTIEIVRYTWGDIDTIELASNLRKKGYLSHYTAMSYHGLTEQIPKSIYINIEQAAKDVSNQNIYQKNIDIALNKKAKLSTNYADYRGYKIFLLNGKATGLLGVDKIETDAKSNLLLTNLERTLIDIIVRPDYSGGIFEVLKAYSNASENVSINKLMAYLKAMDFTYPYHQCIGFLMQSTGKFNESQMQLVRKLPIEFKFYLIHGMQEPQFSKEWNIYYPKDLQL